MEILNLEGTADTPKIILDKGIFAEAICPCN